MTKPDPQPVSALQPGAPAAILVRIEGAMRQMPPSEARVGAMILERPERILTTAIASLAEMAAVSEPTVARFCKSLGYSGFKDFKLALAKSLAGGVPFIHGDVSRDDSSGEIATKVMNGTISALILMRDNIDVASLEAAISTINKARRLEFYGQGNSGFVGLDAQHKFFRLGFATNAYSDPHVHAMSAALLSPDDVAVVFSAAGRTVDIIRTVEIAKRSGAKVIGITVGGSPLARLCDIVVATDVFEDPDVYSPMISRIAHLAIIDVLAVGIAVRRGDGLVQQLERAKRTVRDKRLAAPKSLGNDLSDQE